MNQPVILSLLFLTLVATGCHRSAQRELSPASVAPTTENVTATTANTRPEITTIIVTNTPVIATAPPPVVVVKTAEAIAVVPIKKKPDIETTSPNYFTYAYAQKDAFIGSAQTDLDRLDRDIKEAAEKAAISVESVKSEVQIQLQQVAEKRPDLDKKFEDVKNATSEQWEVAKSAFQQSYDDVKASFRKAWAALPG